MKKKNKLEIIEETREYYEGHPERRSCDKQSGACRYVTRGQGPIKYCAVGRCLKKTSPPINKTSINKTGALYLAESNDEINSWFKPAYQGHDLDFWTNLQCFHDKNKHWGHKTGELTVAGLRAFNTLMKQYAKP